MNGTAIVGVFGGVTTIACVTGYVARLMQANMLRAYIGVAAITIGVMAILAIVGRMRRRRMYRLNVDLAAVPLDEVLEARRTVRRSRID